MPDNLSDGINLNSHSGAKTMNQSFLRKLRVPSIRFGPIAVAVIFAGFNVVSSQNSDARNGNNPYSPSPPKKVKQQESSTAKPAASDVAFTMQPQESALQQNRALTAEQPLKIGESADPRSLPPTEIYKIGAGDVLYINLKNAEQGSGYYTVRKDGTIDFPLAGENVIVTDQTPNNLAKFLASSIKLFPDPQLEVKIREFASHKITVTGLVDNPGEKSLQREAIPLFVLKTDAIVDTMATKVIVTRDPLSKPEIYDLRVANTDNILIYPGNKIDFTSEYGNTRAGSSFYFISGEVVSGGQRGLPFGLTLYQAVIASGGPKGSPKKAIIRRKNEKGIFVIFEHNLRAIKNGKAPDPAISNGDVIEIRN